MNSDKALRLCSVTLFTLTLSTSALADTVFLKNGAAIDGIVTGRHEGNLILSIGNVGTIKIPQDEVERVEKNTRTGYLEPTRSRGKGPREIPDVKDDEDDKNAEKASADEDSGGKESPKEPTPPEEVELDPELEQRIDGLCHDLTRQRTQNRVRAERQLKELGEVAAMKVAELTTHQFVRTRAAAFRILKGTKDFRIAEHALKGLTDEDRFVRKLASEVLQGISGVNESFPWDGPISMRSRAVPRWQAWYDAEKKRLEEEAEKAKKD